jgi:succinate dehydrogenase / fumarate reductase, cytochrome b subunit
MSTAAINPKGPRVYPPGATPTDWLTTYLTSSVGQKILVGFTGISLVGFVFFHMIGNLKMFSGQESINKYAHFLKHDLGVLIWIARAGLLGLFALHLFLAIKLKLMSKKARPIAYANQLSAQASIASKTMIWTGLVTLAFVIFHLAHFTFGYVHEAEVASSSGVVVKTNYLNLEHKGYHDVYSMVKAGFETPWISVLYIVCQLLLFIHLSHGITSSLQTLGLVGKRFTPAAKALGWGLAATIFVGNLAIVVAVWLKQV